MFEIKAQFGKKTKQNKKKTVYLSFEGKSLNVKLCFESRLIMMENALRGMDLNSDWIHSFCLLMATDLSSYFSHVVF